MAENILVTGGAGFIGSHLVDALLESGHNVRIFDNLEPQVHGSLREKGVLPVYLNASPEFYIVLIRDSEALTQALRDIDIVYHFAAATGVGQSMYQITKYFEVNVQGTANLANILANHPHTVRNIVLGSSRAVYGEGAYHCAQCGFVHPGVHTPEQLEQKRWEVSCPNCRNPLTPIPTPETLAPKPGSIYAVTKLTQEHTCLTFGAAYGIPVTVLRFFNVYGTRQPLRNPYTGIITVFLTRLLAGQPPKVYEDGHMTRDFVYVSDVVESCLLAMHIPGGDGCIFNIGSGEAISIMKLANMLCQHAAPEIEPQIVGLSRVGDIRHCTADITHSQKILGYSPRLSLSSGLKSVIDLSPGPIHHEDFKLAEEELRNAGLLRS